MESKPKQITKLISQSINYLKVGIEKKLIRKKKTRVNQINLSNLQLES